MKKFLFIDGKIYFNSIQFLLFPLNSLILILNEIIILEKNYRIIFKKSTLNDSKIILNQINKKLPLFEKLKYSLNILNSFGIGEFKLKKYDNKEFIFICKKPILSLVHYKLFKIKNNNYLEEFNISYILNFVELLTKKQSSYSLKTINNNLILRIKLSNFNLNSSSNLNEFNNYNSNIKTKFEVNNFLKKIIINKNIKNKNGIIKVWKAYASIIPYYSLLNILSELNINRYSLFFKNLGLIQARSAVEIQKTYFGIKDLEKLFNSVNSQSELLGGGKIKFDFKLLNFKISNNLNFYSKKIKNLELIKIYFSSLVQGSYEFIYNKSTTLIKNDANKTNNIYNLKIISNNKILSTKEKKIYNFLKIKIIFLSSLQ